jgi:formylglycine-generating enzyme required for sulfatase activity
LFDDLWLRQADTRPGVGLTSSGLPNLLWRHVPSGTFWMGGDRLALGAWQGCSITLPSDYWTSAYPVTVAQYQAFGVSSHWDAGRSRIGNHPAEVDWYEADAFARWLESLRRDGRLTVPDSVPDTHVIRLVDEAEREWMARYPDGRLFPWGDEYHSGFANIDETSYYDRVGPYYLGRVTAVGIYPSGSQPHLGVHDLSGNVSEWCLTTWSEAGYSADNSPDAVSHRVVRGGHYHNGTSFARAASRTWGDPDPEGQYDPSHGFRLVIGQPYPSRTGEAYASALRWRRTHGWC